MGPGRRGAAPDRCFWDFSPAVPSSALPPASAPTPPSPLPRPRPALGPLRSALAVSPPGPRPAATVLRALPTVHRRPQTTDNEATDHTPAAHVPRGLHPGLGPAAPRSGLPTGPFTAYVLLPPRHAPASRSRETHGRQMGGPGASPGPRPRSAKYITKREARSPSHTQCVMRACGGRSTSGSLHRSRARTHARPSPEPSSVSKSSRGARGADSAAALTAGFEDGRRGHVARLLREEGGKPCSRWGSTRTRRSAQPLLVSYLAW